MNVIVAKALEWLRAGYPTGVPSTDYLPIFALLRRKLSEEEVQEVAKELIALQPLEEDRVDAGVEITKVTDDMPHEEDLRRVLERLEGTEIPPELR